MDRLLRAAVKLAQDAQYTDEQIVAVLLRVVAELKARKFRMEAL